MNATERNLQIKKFISTMLENPSKSSIDNHLKKIIDNIIACSALGFRGIILTAFAGKYLDNKFNPTIDFYACNPRSIFEKGIRLALEEKRIPCGKSDPLNVAKNIQQIDEKWARGKRPEEVAMNVAALLHYIFNKNIKNNEYNKIQSYFFFELNKLKKEKILLLRPQNVHNILEEANSISQFIYDNPEGGSVPQYFCGKLISIIFESKKDHYKVYGLDSDVNATNTTSKKPGDIWVVNELNRKIQIYEITMKPIDLNRLEDYIQNIERLNLDGPIYTYFICRFPEDIAPLSLKKSSCELRSHTIYFINISEWFYYNFINLSIEERRIFFNGVNDFLNELKRSPQTCHNWENLINRLQLSS